MFTEHAGWKQHTDCTCLCLVTLYYLFSALTHPPFLVHTLQNFHQGLDNFPINSPLKVVEPTVLFWFCVYSAKSVKSWHITRNFTEFHVSKFQWWSTSKNVSHMGTDLICLLKPVYVYILSDRKSIRCNSSAYIQWQYSRYTVCTQLLDAVKETFLSTGQD